MNGTALAMSAVPGDKHHLVKWLGTQPEEALIPRRLFGQYLRERFYQAISGRTSFHVERAEAVDLIPADAGYALTDDRGARHLARNVVLALGNFPPDDAFLPEELRRHRGYVADPWRFDPRGEQGDVLIIGSGLTALDAIALLDERGFSGTIHLLSRHGLLPCIDNPHARALDPKRMELRTETPYALLRTLRAQARRHVEAGGDWRDTVEAIRAMSPSIWSSWSLRERRRFVRHLQAFWAIHRYRVPPQTAAAYQRLDRQRRIVRHRGRITAVHALANGSMRIEIDGAGGATAANVAASINCTGPNGNYERVRHPFVRNLLRRGLLRPDPLHLGLDATAELRVIDRHGHPSENLFALGPPLRGIWYETTAVPETREQAGSIARSLIAQHSARRLEAAS